jgi:hypothetical protein
MKPSHLKPVMLMATLSAAVVACETPLMSPEPPEPSFAVVQNDRFFIDVDFFLFPPCNSEPTESHGTVHIVFSETVTPSGRVNLNLHGNANGTGVGLDTGAKYQWNDAFNGNLSDGTDGLPHIETFVQRIRLIGQGQVPDGYFDLLFHITINPNGDATAFKLEVSPACT